jgi:hypothetical protein
LASGAFGLFEDDSISEPEVITTGIAVESAGFGDIGTQPASTSATNISCFNDVNFIGNHNLLLQSFNKHHCL